MGQMVRKSVGSGVLCCVVVMLLVGALSPRLAAAEELVPSVPESAYWVSLPIYGGEMTSIAMDATSAQTLNLQKIYVGTRNAGVFKSIDGGASWQGARQGLSFHPITSLQVDPGYPDTVYAGTESDGVWKSVDGGQTWAKSSQGIEQTFWTSRIYHILVHPQDSEVVYASEGGSYGHIHKSEDGGAHWQARDTGIPRDYMTFTSAIFALTLDPDTPDTLYAGTRDAGAFKSTDGGETWTAINDGIPAASGQGLVEVNALSVDSHHVDRVGAIIDGHYYVLGADGQWNKVSQGAAVAYTSGPCQLHFHPNDPDVMYVAGHHFSKSTDGGITWHRYLGFPTSGPVAQVAFHPATPDTLFAALGVQYEHRGGVYKSQDQGENWFDASEGITAVTVQGVAVDPQDPDHLYAGLSSWMDSGVWHSHDGGASWQFSYIGKDLLDIAVDPRHSQKLYVAAGTTLFKSTDQATSFQEVPAVEDAQCVAVVSDAASTVYVGAREGVYKSVDGGMTWQPRNTGLPPSATGGPPAITCITVDPNASATIWAGTRRQGLMRSTDGGAHWTLKGFSDIEDVDAVAVKPGDSRTILVGTGELDVHGRRGEIYQSTDGGETWSLTHQGVATVTDIKYDPRNPEWVYAATGHIPWLSNPNDGEGVLRSFDGGEHWHDYSAGIFYPTLYSIAIGPVGSPSLIAGSFGSGLYGITPAEPHVVSLPLVLSSR